MPIHYQYLFHLSSYHVFPFKCCSCVSESKRKRVIAEPEGVQAKSLKKVMLPEKSDSTPLILAIEPTPQNLGYRNYAGRCFALVSTYCPIVVLTFIPGGLCDIIVHYSLLIHCSLQIIRSILMLTLM